MKRGIILGCFFVIRFVSGADLFSSKIEPLLKQRCFECHSHEKKIKGGLALDSKSGWEKGGDSGPAIVPGKPEASLLIQAVSHVEKDLKMPPKTMLPAAEIALLTEWVRQGAPDPRLEPIRSKVRPVPAPKPSGPTITPEVAGHAERFRREVFPLVDKSCASCHDADAREGGVVLTSSDGTFDQPAEVAMWKKVRRVLAEGRMPPEDADPIPPADSAALTGWIDRGLDIERGRLATKGSRHVVRRLTNREFNRSLLTLVGAESSLRDFVTEENAPADAVENTGFSNDAAANPLTKAHLESFKKAALTALGDFAPFIEKARPPLHYFYHGEHCYTSRATQDHVFDFVKNVVHPLSEHEFRTRREIEQITGKSFLGRPMNKAVFGPVLFPFQPGPLEKFDNDLLLANAAAFPASDMYSRGTFQFRLRVRGKPAADGTLPVLRIRIGHFDVFANHFRTLSSQQLTEKEQVLEFAGNVKDFPFLDSIPPHRTFRDGNVPKLASFSANEWYDCLGALFIVLVENASRHEKGLPKTPGLHRYSPGNLHIGSYDEIYERARAKTLPNYYMRDSELVEVFRKNQTELAGKAPGIEIDWAELTLADVPQENAVFFATPERGPTDAYAEKVIGRFYDRAARGYGTPAGLRPFLDLYRHLRADGVGFEKAVHEVLATALISPEHLFLGDFGAPGDRRGRALLLAGKLSFWLWGEPPDTKLLAACEEGRLLDDTVLTAEVERMFADPRARRFVDHFLTEAWHLDRFDQININVTQHPHYDPELEADIKEQFRLTVHDAFGLNGRASVLSMIADDHLWVNRRLAALSRVEGYKGRGEFLKVKLPPDSPLGGVLTQARIMKMNSDGTDSHPVRRGTWLLERILHDPPPPPPKVTPLKEQGLIKATTLRERIAEHARSGDSCMGCHRRIDPFGLAFENFDATGAWRDAVSLGEKQEKVDIAFKLEDGRTIGSLRELKTYILETKAEAFSHGFVESLLQYAIGRRLDPLDDLTVDAARRVFASSGYDFAALLKAVATSPSFKGIDKGTQLNQSNTKPNP
jgi:mono/diheme cytochrome c family protein